MTTLHQLDPLESVVYIAVAYRWGELNNHNYMVAAGADRESICEIASDEADFRGGKYGVAVFEASNVRDSAVTGQCCAYYKSMAGEDEPYTNRRSVLAERLGFKAVLALEDGYVRGEPNEAGESEKLPTGFPDWFVAKHVQLAREERLLEFFEAHHKLRQSFIAAEGFAWARIAPRTLRSLWSEVQQGAFELEAEEVSTDGGILTRVYRKGMETLKAYWVTDSLDGSPFGMDRHSPLLTGCP